jgi:hypothetical protein
MAKMKRQKFQEGAIVKIEISENRLAFARLLPGYKIGIYNYVSRKGQTFSHDEIISSDIFIYLSIYRTVITKGIYEIIGFKDLQKEEVEKIPPQFMQDSSNVNDCIIFDYNGNEYKTNPENCVELERSAVWDEHSIKQRIEDNFAGRKNFHRELQRVILSKDDPRYLNSKVRWDSKEERFC